MHITIYTYMLMSIFIQMYMYLDFMSVSPKAGKQEQLVLGGREEGRGVVKG